MTDQNTQFFAILTAVGEAKQANAAALGTSWTFAQMAVGDANGTDPIPSRTQTKLINERRRAPLNQVKVDPANASVIIAEQIIPESVGGWWVRELALYDADGDMVAVANCAPTYKSLLAQGSGRTQVIRINLIVSSTANIELKIDPSVVLATREYVDTSVMEAIAKLDFKHSVLVATTANIVLSGIQAIDGEMLTAGARVLVKDQAQAKDNGIYVVPASGAWKRAQDADTSVEVTPGLFVSVEKGTLNSDSVWQLVTDAPIVLGTTALSFEMVAGRTGISAGSYASITVDKYGRVIAGTNPTTLAGHGITDAFTKTQVVEAIQASAAAVVINVSAAKTLTAEDIGIRGLVLISAANAALSVQLPEATAALGIRDVVVRRVDNSGNRLTVQAAGTNKIKFHTHLAPEGYPFLVLMGAGDWWHLRSDGAGGWWPIGRFDSTALGRPVFETTTVIGPGGYGAISGLVFNRAEWPWLWDHAQASGMLVSEAARVNMEGGWTSGDGASTFRGPEGRGEFVRFCDETRGVDVVNFSGNITSGSPTITGMRFQGVVLTNGMVLTGVGIPVGTTVTGFSVAASTITMSANATATTASLTITATGRAPGSRQNGTLVAQDMDGSAGFGVTSGPSPEQPRISRGDLGQDAPVISDYPAGIGASFTSPGASVFNLSSSAGWYGVTRPRNIAYPGRIKLI